MVEKLKHCKVGCPVLAWLGGGLGGGRGSADSAWVVVVVMEMDPNVPSVRLESRVEYVESASSSLE